MTTLTPEPTPFTLAQGFKEKHNYSDAVDAYRAALGAFEPGGEHAEEHNANLHRKEGYNGLAGSLSSSWRHQEAFATYFEIKEILEGLKEQTDGKAELATELAEVYARLGHELYSLRKYGEARGYYEKAAKFYLDQAAGARSDAAMLKDEEVDRKEVAQEKINGAEDSYIDRCGDLGSTYSSIQQYDKAIEHFELAVQAGKRRGEDYPYAHHNLALTYQILGRYQEARHELRQAELLYREGYKSAGISGWIGHFQYYGELLYENGDLAAAAKVYEDGLRLCKDPKNKDQLNEDHIGILLDQVTLYLEEKNDDPKKRDFNNHAAREAYKQAKSLLTRILANSREVETLLIAGELALTIESYEEAEELLKEAFSQNAVAEAPYVRSAKPATDLGVLYMRQNKFKEAIHHFELAAKVKEYDLTILSNLAEAYLKDGQLKEAERNFHKALDIAPDHMESKIGLAGVYTAFGESGDPEMYDAAIEQYSQVITLSERKEGSKRLKKKELAGVLYSIGYARVKSCEGSKNKNQSLLRTAQANFSKCFKIDPQYFLAKRAVDKISKVLTPRSPQNFLEMWGPLVIFLLSFLVFIFTQIVFFVSQVSFLLSVNRVRPLAVTSYTALTFGSLVLMVAGSYLPQLVKLKVPGIELEKSIVDQTTTIATVGISKG